MHPKLKPIVVLAKFSIFLSFPEHEDDHEEEEEEVELEQVAEKLDKEKPKSQNSSRRSKYSDAQSRTPSRSPTPRRHTDDEDTMEARALRNRSQEASPADSRDDSADDDQRHEEEEGLEASVVEEEEKEELPPYLPSVYGCRNMDEFEVRFIALGYLVTIVFAASNYFS